MEEIANSPTLLINLHLGVRLASFLLICLSALALALEGANELGADHKKRVSSHLRN